MATIPATSQVHSNPITRLTWADVDGLAKKLAERHEAVRRGYDRPLPVPIGIYGIPNGGAIVAALVREHLRHPSVIVDEPHQATLIVDDLIETGRTMKAAVEAAFTGPGPHPSVIFNDALLRKSNVEPIVPVGHEVPQLEGWVEFPWERRLGGGVSGPTDAVVRLLEFIGENPHRDGLLATPARVVKAWKELTSGYAVDTKALLGTVFEEPAEDMVIVDGIEFASTCEHHLLPFHGRAAVAYVPQGGKVVGLSKIPRLVQAFARRLQLQERLTRQVAEELEDVLKPKGVAVVMRAHHSCMGLRGVRCATANMITSHVTGVFREPAARAEFLQLAKV